jgi:hypothetical protein
MALTPFPLSLRTESARLCLFLHCVAEDPCGSVKLTVSIGDGYFPKCLYPFFAAVG